MRSKTTSPRALGWLATIAAGTLLLSTCNKPATSVLLQLYLAENVTEPEQLRVVGYDNGGEAFAAQTLTPEPLSPQRGIGSMIVYPPAADVKAVRLYVRGVKAGMAVAQGVIRFNFQPNMQGERSLILMRDIGGDRDGDDLPDSIDNCPDVSNADQRDDDRDGTGNACEGEQPAPLGNGASCKGDRDCTSGNCVGGICCNGKCDDQCSSCSLPDRRGTCTRKPVSADAGADTCGADGGLSPDAAPIAPPGPTDPAPPAGANGATCEGTKDCNSGFCVEGVCCADACEGVCQTCRTPTNPGTCQPRPAGEPDRRDRCAAEATSTCGRDGKCDGAGACRKHTRGTVCQPGGCASPMQEKTASVCDGAGTCEEKGTKLCAPFLCGPDACRTACTGTDQCALGSVCTGGVCVGNGPCGPVACPTGDLTNGLILHHAFEERPGSFEAQDRSGNDNRGTLKDATPQTAWQMGRVGGALYFTGNANGSHLVVPSSPSLNEISTGFSIAAWVWRDFFWEYKHTLVARRSSGAGGSHYELVIEQNKLRVRINSANGYKGDVATTTEIPANKWVHVATTYDVTTGAVAVYVDGILSQRGQYMLQIGPDVSPVTIGGAERGGAVVYERFQGRMDEVVIYKRPLTEAEIKGLAAGAQPPMK